MKTQITRDAHRPEKRYSGVYQQQGRMLTDADWNALAEIEKRRLDDALADVVGSGAPREGGLRVTQADFTPPTPAPPLTFVGSRLYAGGVPAQVATADPEHDFSYRNQADFPGAPTLPVGTAFNLYADVWERTVVSLEDADPWDADHLRDPALHGADTTTRTQTMAQVKWCPTGIKPEDPKVNPSFGNAQLTVKLRETTGGADPCAPCASAVAVDQRVGNYLFRLEVHDVKGPADAPTEVTLKWSSENGAEQHAVGTEPPDFGTGGFVYERFNDVTEKLLGVHLADDFTPPRVELEETFSTTPPPNPPVPNLDRIRRWDGYVVLTRDGAGKWSPAKGRDNNAALSVTVAPAAAGGASERLTLSLKALDLDLSVKDSLFVAGDYWLAAVRESVHKAGDTLLNAALPVGIVHHYLHLADVGEGGQLVLPTSGQAALRLGFPPLSNLRSQDVSYEAKSGSGCEALNPRMATVKDALDALCARPGGGISCRVTVGQGGEFGTIQEALEGLLSNNRTNISLCLLPGEHLVNNVPVRQGIDLSICGSGPGCLLHFTERVQVNIFGLRSLRIADLSIKMEQAAWLQAQGDDIVLERLVATGPPRPEGGGAAFILGAFSSIRVAESRFRFFDTSLVSQLGFLLADSSTGIGELFKSNFDDDRFREESRKLASNLSLFLSEADRAAISFNLKQLSLPPSLGPDVGVSLLRLASALIRPPFRPGLPLDVLDSSVVEHCLIELREATLQQSPSLVLSLGGPEADVTLIDNQILGTVSVYGFPDEGLKGEDLRKLVQSIRTTPQKIEFIPAGSLSVVRNKMARIFVGSAVTVRLRQLASMPDPLGDVMVHRTAYLSENRFTAADSSVVGQDVHLTNNVFDTKAKQRLGWAIAESATCTGNGTSIPIVEQFMIYSHILRVALNQGLNEHGAGSDVIRDDFPT